MYDRSDLFLLKQYREQVVSVASADDLCPWCGGELEADHFSGDQHEQIKSATCMECYATFTVRPARRKRGWSVMSDDALVPFLRGQ